MRGRIMKIVVFNRGRAGSFYVDEAPLILKLIAGAVDLTHD